MWLDRLAGHATPAQHPPSASQPQLRSYSPAPRRPNHLQPQLGSQRNFSPRSSSLTLQSNGSSTSLLGVSRKSDGNAIKQGSAAPDPQTPLGVLERIVGRPAATEPKTDKTTIKHSDDDEELDLALIDFGGLSLQEFISRGDKTAVSAPSHFQTAEEYKVEKAKYEDLHKSIRACDDILSSVEANLTSFQNDLGAVSAEIETLQARSTALSLRLENRKLVEKGLGPVVEEITIAPAVVRKLAEGPIDEGWIRALHELEKRAKALDAKSQKQQNIKCINDLRPLLGQLVDTAIQRIRDFLVAQIKSLRSPNINAQIIQQQHFIRYKDLFAFLHSHHAQLAEEIGQAYMNTMRWYYSHHFNRYERILAKTKLHHIDKHDLLGADDGTRKATGTSLLSSSKHIVPHDAFNLGRRADVLAASSQAVPGHLVEDDKATHYLEFPFRNFNLALVDNVAAEYGFLTSFFAPALSLQTIARYFTFTFAPTLNLGLQLTRELSSDTTDCLGLLLCIRLCQKLNFRLQHDKVPVAEGYLNSITMSLWPRFQVIMDQHCETVKKLTSSLPSGPPSSRSELAKQSAAPHFLTQRFGAFVQGILELSKEAGDDEPVSSSLARLRGVFQAFMERVAKSIADPRIRKRFLDNNYALILTICSAGEGKLAAEQRKHFEELREGLTEA